MEYVSYIRNLVGNKKIFMTAAAAIITNEKNQILLQLRGDDHTWGLPGGIMELEETPEDTVVREVKEETNLDIEELSLVGIFHNKHKEWPNSDKAHIICFVYHANKIEGDMKIDNVETLKLSYFHYDSLPNIGAVDHREAIDAFYKKREVMT